MQNIDHTYPNKYNYPIWITTNWTDFGFTRSIYVYPLIHHDIVAEKTE